MNPAAPEQILQGRYRIERALGAGGMGVVYLAEDLQLQRWVAIKKMRPDTASDSAGARIQSEAQLLARLNHPHIVQLYDVIDSGDSIALVMEYVEGAPLSAWMRDQQRSLAAKLELLAQICRGLDAAHRLGIVHRDLKLDNILVAGDGSAKIADFGIARSVDSGTDRLTRDGKVVGSLDTMAPEQLRGEAPQPHSDLFTLGLLAYQLLCGQHPFGENRSPYTTAERILRKAHPPATRFNPELAPALNRLLDRLLAKNPAQRPASAGAVADKLERIGREPADSGRRHIRSAAANKIATSEAYFHRRRRHPAALAVGIALFAGAALTAALWWHKGSPTASAAARYIAVLAPQSTPEGRRAFTRSTLGAIRRALANRSGLRLVPYAESSAQRERPRPQLAAALNAQLLLIPVLDCDKRICQLALDLFDADSGSVTRHQSAPLNIDDILGSIDRTLQLVNQLLPDNPSNPGDPSEEIAGSDYQQFLQLESRSYDYRTIEVLPETLDALDSLQKRAPSYAPLYDLYARIAFDDRFSNRAMGSLDRLEQFLARAPDNIAGTREVLVGHYLLASGRYDWEAAEHALAALKPVITDSARYYYMEAIYHHMRGDYDRALQSIDHALALRTGVTYLMQKALILSYAGDMPSARPLLQRILKLDPSYLDASALLAANDLDMGEIEESIQLLEEITPEKRSAMDLFNLCQARYLNGDLALSDRCFADLYQRLPDDLEPLLYRAEIARLQGEPRRARQLALQVRDLGRDREGWENRLILARAYAQLGQREKAVATLMQIRQQATDDTYVNNALAQAYIATDDLTSAAATIRRALELGQSPIWYRTKRFTKLCSHPTFAGLRADYPALCADPQKNREIVASGGTG